MVGSCSKDYTRAAALVIVRGIVVSGHEVLDGQRRWAASGGTTRRPASCALPAATDDLIKAIDIKTGEILWSDVLPAGGQATPIVYEQNGKEFVVIMAGGHHFMKTPPGDALIAYALPDTK